MKVSRKSIAAAAGVSSSTVGMILSGSGARYNEETRKRVFRVAKEMGYRPSINARALRLKRSLLVGILLHDINSHFAADFLHGVQQALAATDYSPLVFFAKTPEEQADCLARCRERMVDGFMINCVIDPQTASAGALINELGVSATAIVEIFGRFLATATKVNVDNYQAGKQMAEHLIGLGHRRIALLTHSRYQLSGPHFDAWEQACGYRDTMRAAGLEPIIVARDLDFDNVSETSFLQAGFEAMDAILDHPGAPSAVICYGDQMAYGINRACRIRGIDVPGKLALCGTGGLILSALANPPLTTISPPYVEVGRVAATKLLEIIDGKTPGDSLVAPALELRASTVAPAG